MNRSKIRDFLNQFTQSNGDHSAVLVVLKDQYLDLIETLLIDKDEYKDIKRLLNCQLNEKYIEKVYHIFKFLISTDREIILCIFNSVLDDEVPSIQNDKLLELHLKKRLVDFYFKYTDDDSMEIKTFNYNIRKHFDIEMLHDEFNTWPIFYGQFENVMDRNMDQKEFINATHRILNGICQNYNNLEKKAQEYNLYDMLQLVQQNNKKYINIFDTILNSNLREHDNVAVSYFKQHICDKIKKDADLEKTCNSFQRKYPDFTKIIINKLKIFLPDYKISEEDYKLNNREYILLLQLTLEPIYNDWRRDYKSRCDMKELNKCRDCYSLFQDISEYNKMNIELLRFRPILDYHAYFNKIINNINKVNVIELLNFLQRLQRIDNIYTEIDNT